MSTNYRLGEIKARADAATKGPWEFRPAGESRCGEPACCYEWWENGVLDASGTRLFEDSAITDSDCAFIAHAREDVPWLLDQVVGWQNTAAFYITEVERLKANAQRVLAWHEPTVVDGRARCDDC